MLLPKLCVTVTLGIAASGCSLGQKGGDLPNRRLYVEFSRSSATPMQAVASIAAQATVPMAIIYGRDRDLLCERAQSFSISNMPARGAFEIAASKAGYEVEQKNGVTEIVAPDLTRWQRKLLGHRFSVYRFEPNAVLNELFAQLQGALLIDAEGVKGYAGSTLSTPDALRFTLAARENVSTEEVANSLVTLDSHALWVFKAAPEPTEPPTGDQFDIYSYRDDLALIKELTCK